MATVRIPTPLRSFTGGKDEITIAGNLLEMYGSLVAADDLEFRGSTNAPSLLVGAMTIAGD